MSDFSINNGPVGSAFVATGNPNVQIAPNWGNGAGAGYKNTLTGDKLVFGSGATPSSGTVAFEKQGSYIIDNSPSHGSASGLAGTIQQGGVTVTESKDGEVKVTDPNDPRYNGLDYKSGGKSAINELVKLGVIHQDAADALNQLLGSGYGGSGAGGIQNVKDAQGDFGSVFGSGSTGAASGSTGAASGSTGAASGSTGTTSNGSALFNSTTGDALNNNANGSQWYQNNPNHYNIDNSSTHGSDTGLAGTVESNGNTLEMGKNGELTAIANGQKIQRYGNGLAGVEHAVQDGLITRQAGDAFEQLLGSHNGGVGAGGFQNVHDAQSDFGASTLSSATGGFSGTSGLRSGESAVGSVSGSSGNHYTIGRLGNGDYTLHGPDGKQVLDFGTSPTIDEVNHDLSAAGYGSLSGSGIESVIANDLQKIYGYTPGQDGYTGLSGQGNDAGGG